MKPQADFYRSINALDIFPLCDWTWDQQVLKIRMLFHNVGVPHPSAMIRREVMIQNDIWYDERIIKSQDYKLWVDLIPFGSIMMLNEILLLYRVHEQQISSDRKNQYQYAHQIALEQAERLLGNMSSEEKDFHCCAHSIDVCRNDVNGYSKYMKHLIQANEECGIYDKSKFKREITYSWAQKAFRRVLKFHKFDMIFNSFMFGVLRPGFFSYLKENKQVKRMRSKALSIADFQDCTMR